MRHSFTTKTRSHEEFVFTKFLHFSVLLWFIIVCLTGNANAQIHFQDITAQAGIHFTHNNGAFGKKWLPETMGPGCAFIDYDNDGFPDVLLVNGQDRSEERRVGKEGR